jgi:mannitol-1-/sugar-/sorbitol-6-phosphatase
MPHEHHNFQYDCDAVLFDLDGVLVDSRHCIERHWVEWAAKHKLNADHVLHYSHGRRTEETIRFVAPHLDVEHETAEFEAGEAFDTVGLIKIPGALELLQSIPADAWGIATSGTRTIATTRLNFGGLPVPDVLISAEDVQAGKPNPEPYLFAALMLGVKPERCVVIEDAPAGIQAGRAAGAHVVGVISSVYTAEELRQAHAVVRHIGDIEVHVAPKGSLGRLIVKVKGI